MEARQRRKPAPRLYLLTAGIVLAVSVLIALLLWGLIQNNEKTLLAMRREQQTVIDEVRELGDQIEYAKTDDFVEDAARDYGMINPGDVRYEPAGN